MIDLASVRTSEFIVENAAHGQRLDRVVTAALPAESRATLQRWIKEGRVRLDGETATPSTKVRAGNKVSVEPGPSPLSAAVPDPTVEVDVVYADPHLLVVNKPPHQVVHPAKGHLVGTLVNGLLCLPDFGRPPSDPFDTEGHLRPGIVHRIDKGTSGLLVIAKDDPTREGLKSQFAAHSLERSYLALCIGVPKAGEIQSRHGRHPTQRLKFTSLAPEGKWAETHLELLAKFAGRASLVRCRLKTGRTHQIRVHLTEQRQTPLLGDTLYYRLCADPQLNQIATKLGRPALHAAELGFTHPITKALLHFEVAPPADFMEAQAALHELG